MPHLAPFQYKITLIMYDHVDSLGNAIYLYLSDLANSNAIKEGFRRGAIYTASAFVTASRTHPHNHTMPLARVLD